VNRNRRRLTGRMLVALVAAVLVAAALAGAGTARSRHAALPAVSGNVVLSGWASSGVEFDFLNKVVKTFEKKNPSIHVTYQPINGNYPQAMLARFASHTPPDVFYVDSSVAPDWMSKGVLLPLNSLFRQHHFSTRPFFKRLLQGFTWKGKIYGLPKDWSPLAMQVNTAMLQKAGVSAPTSWTKLVSVARKMQVTSAVPGGAPICLGADWARMLAFIYQGGGSYLNARGTRPVLNTAAAKKAINFYVGLETSGLGRTPDQLGVGWCGEALGKQKAAIIFEGNWAVPYMHDTFPDVKYATYPMPHGRNKGSLAFTVSYSIAKDSRNKPAAWKLLSYLTSRSGMATWTNQGLALPSRSDVRPAAGRAVFLKEAPYSHAWSFFPGFSDVYTIMNNDLTAVFQGKKDVQGMINDVQTATAKALKRR
jgi:multiple sugar transport system substrate-binding protein